MTDRPPAPAPGSVDTDVRDLGEAVVVTVAGEVDLRTTPALDQALDDALASAAPDTADTTGRALVVDLRATTFLASSGMAALCRAQDHGRERGVPVRLVMDRGGAIAHVLQVTGLDALFPIHHTLIEAQGSDTG